MIRSVSTIPNTDSNELIKYKMENSGFTVTKGDYEDCGFDRSRRAPRKEVQA